MIQEAESGDQGVERRGKGGEKEARERGRRFRGLGSISLKQKVFFVADIWHSDIFISQDIGYIYGKIGSEISWQRIIVENCAAIDKPESKFRDPPTKRNDQKSRSATM